MGSHLDQKEVKFLLTFHNNYYSRIEIDHIFFQDWGYGSVLGQLPSMCEVSTPTLQTTNKQTHATQTTPNRSTPSQTKNMFYMNIWKLGNRKRSLIMQ